MIQLAIICQVLAVLFAVAYFKSEKTPPLAPGQVYESCHTPSDGGYTSIFYHTVVEVKGDYVKYRLQGLIPNPASGEQVETTVSFMRYKRLITPTPNPFESETNQ